MYEHANVIRLKVHSAARNFDYTFRIHKRERQFCLNKCLYIWQKALQQLSFLQFIHIYICIAYLEFPNNQKEIKAKEKSTYKICDCVTYLREIFLFHLINKEAYRTYVRMYVQYS